MVATQCFGFEKGAPGSSVERVRVRIASITGTQEEAVRAGMTGRKQKALPIGGGEEMPTLLLARTRSFVYGRTRVSTMSSDAGVDSIGAETAGL